MIGKKSPLNFPVSTLLFVLFETNMYYIHELYLVIDKKHRNSLLACITADGEVIQINNMQIKRHVFTCTNAHNSLSSVVTINDKTEQFILNQCSTEVLLDVKASIEKVALLQIVMNATDFELF